MTAPDGITLDAAALDRWVAAVERMEVWPATAFAVAAQARAALALRDELAEEEALRNRMGDILTLTVNALKGEPDPRSLHDWATLPEVARTLVNELAEAKKEMAEWRHDCRTAQGDVDVLTLQLAECRAECMEQARLLGVGGSVEADLRAKLVQAEQERDEARAQRNVWADQWEKVVAAAHVGIPLAAAQAETLKLREALANAQHHLPHGMALAKVWSTLARAPGSRAALREWTVKACEFYETHRGEHTPAECANRLLGEEGGQS